jgi:acyl-CoA thioesterase-2
MADFEHDTRTTTTDEGLQTTLSPNWQVMGPQGGYVAAIALRAMAGLVQPGFVPAALTAQYLTAAASGPAEVEVRLLRQGRSAAFTTATVRQGGTRERPAGARMAEPGEAKRPFPEGARNELGASASFFFRVEGPTRLALTPPTPPPPEACVPLPMPAPPGQRFAFHENFEFRVSEGLFQEPGAEEDFIFWARYREQSWGEDVVVQAASLIPLLDMAVFPASFRTIPNFPGAVTLDLTAHWHSFPIPQGWLLLRGTCQYASSGMLHGWSEAWAPDGRLLATASQQAVLRK